MKLAVPTVRSRSAVLRRASAVLAAIVFAATLLTFTPSNALAADGRVGYRICQSPHFGGGEKYAAGGLYSKFTKFTAYRHYEGLTSQSVPSGCGYVRYAPHGSVLLVQTGRVHFPPSGVSHLKDRRTFRRITLKHDITVHFWNGTRIHPNYAVKLSRF